MHDIKREYRWTKEALAVVKNNGMSIGVMDSHKMRFPIQYSHFLDKDEQWLEDHKERLERDIASLDEPYSEQIKLDDIDDVDSFNG